MLALVLFCGVLAILFAFAVVTQILLPLYRGTPVFPIFCTSELKEKVAELESEVEAAVETANLKTRLKQLSSKKASLK